MSWSSEFEPGRRDPSLRGRSLSFSEEEIQETSDFRRTQELARIVIPEEPEPPKNAGPSRILVALTLVLAVATLAALAFYVWISVVQASEVEETFDADIDAGSAADVASLVESLDTTALSFEPGTTRFSPEGAEAAEAIRSELRKSPADMLALEVRTYSEESSKENHRLSQKQAAAIRKFLTKDGLISARQVTARGLGSADIHAGDQHPYFITVDLPSASVAIQNSIVRHSGFAFSGPPSAWPESGTKALQGLADVLEDKKDTDVVFNVHSFEPVPEAEQDSAYVSSKEQQQPALLRRRFPSALFEPFDVDALGEPIKAFLSERGIDASRISINHVEGESVQVPTGVNTVVSVQAGRLAEITHLLDEVPEVRFVRGKPNVDKSGRESLDEIAAVLTETSETILVDVHTFSEETAEKNKTLSEGQANAVANYLIKQGVDSSRIKTAGSGNSSQFDESKKLTITVLSVSP